MLAMKFGLLDEHKTTFRVGAVVFGVALVAGGVVWQRAAKRRADELRERLSPEDQAYLMLVADKRWHEALALSELLANRMPGNHQALVATATPLSVLGKHTEAMDRLELVISTTSDEALRKQAGELASDLKKARTARRDSIIASALLGLLFAWGTWHVGPAAIAKKEWAGLGFLGGMATLCFLIAVMRAIAARNERRGNRRPAAPSVHKALWGLLRAEKFDLAKAVAGARMAICPSDLAAKLTIDSLENGQPRNPFRESDFLPR